MLRILLLACAVCLFPLGAHCDQDLPFCAGEILTFGLRWQAIPAGTAELTVLPVTDVDGQSALHFRVVAKSNGFVDVFYKVRDRVDSYVAPDMGKSLLYVKKQREGSYKRDITVKFQWDKGRAQYSNVINGPKEPIVILPGTFDPLSVFYAFRLMNIGEGAVVRRPVTDGVKCVIGQATVVGRETVTVPAGTFDTYLVEPDLEHVGGVFKKSKNAKLKVWVTADERRIPVKVASRVVVGNFYAELERLSAPFGCYGPPAEAPGVEREAGSPAAEN